MRDGVILKVTAATLVLGLGALVVAYGTEEAGAREVVRWTARVSLLLFCAALATEGRRVARWASRRSLLRSLAVSHTVHLAAIVWLAVLIGGTNLRERLSLLGGGVIAYAFIYWAAWKPDSRLASWGLGWVWIVFFVSYLGRALRMPMPFGFAIVLLAAALGARLLALRRRAPVAAAATPMVTNR